MNVIDLDLAVFASVLGDVKRCRCAESLLLELVEDLDSDRKGLRLLLCDGLREAFAELQQRAIMGFSVVVVWVIRVV